MCPLACMGNMAMRTPRLCASPMQRSVCIVHHRVVVEDGVKIKIPSRLGDQIGFGSFSSCRTLGSVVVYQGYAGEQDLAKLVLLVAHQRCPTNPHLPALDWATDGRLVAPRYERHMSGFPDSRDCGVSRVTRHSVGILARLMCLAPAEKQALHVIVDVVETLPQSLSRMAKWDIRDVNVMVNSKGEMVFTDPIFFAQ